MGPIISKGRVKKVVQHDDCQEVFYADHFGGTKSIKIHNCKRDIASMLQKSFWRCKSTIEIHFLYAFPIRIYLDNLLICELKEQDYPEKLKQKLASIRETNDRFKKQMENFLQHYPKKGNLEAEVFSVNSIVLRAYAGAIIDKLKSLGKLQDDLCQRRYALLLDIFKFLSDNKEFIIVHGLWPNILDEKRGFLSLTCTPENFPEILKQKLRLADIEGFDRQILNYLTRMVGEFYSRHNTDENNLSLYLADIYGLFTSRTVDRQLIIQFNRHLDICSPWDDIPDFITDESISETELKYYLSKQNW